MKYMLCRAGGTHSNINKPNERKIHTDTLFHLGFVEIISLLFITSSHKGVTRGVFPANHSPSLPLLHRRFSDQKKIIQPSYSLPFPLEFRNHMWCEKTTVVGLQGREKTLTISLSVSIQYRRVTDRQPRDDSNSRACA